MPCKGDDVGGVVEASHRGVEISKGGVAVGGHVVDVRCPCTVLVGGEGYYESAAVEDPPKNDLDFGWASFGDKFGVGEDVATDDWFICTSMGTAG